MNSQMTEHRNLIVGISCSKLFFPQSKRLYFYGFLSVISVLSGHSILFFSLRRDILFGDLRRFLRRLHMPILFYSNILQVWIIRQVLDFGLYTETKKGECRYRFFSTCYVGADKLNVSKNNTMDNCISSFIALFVG